MKPLRDIFRYTKGLKVYMIVIAIISVFTAVLAFARPFIIKLATDWVVAVHGHHVEFGWMPLIGFGALLALAAIVSSALNDIGGYFGDQLSIRTRHQLSTAYFTHLLTLPQKYYDDEVSGKIVSRLNRAITDITNFLQFFSNNLLQMLLTTILTIVVLLIYNWQLAVLFAILIPANLYLTARTSGKWQRYEKEKNEHFDRASGRFNEVVSQMRLVKSFGTEKRERTYFDNEVQQMIGLTANQSRHWHSMNFLRSLVFGIINTLILVVIFYSAGKGTLTIGDLAMLVTLIQQAAFPLNGLSFFVDNYQRAVANSRDYLTAMNEKPEVQKGRTKALKVTRGKVQYHNVDFAYNKSDKPLLHDISFTIEPGKKLALVGESGGGKTTISNLLMDLYHPTSGSVAIDGQNLSTVSQRSVREAIATVFQDPALFSGTIRENITYANPSASDKQVENAARAANAHDFIMKFPKGYDTEIGERGVKLSGGQKQRLSIARAILKDAPILILDEATSSLDGRAEHEVQEALDRLMKHRTTLIIAHRLSTIAGVDTIVTLRNGHVDEIGTPEQLAKTDGIYAQLLKLQLGASEAAKKRLAKFEISV